MTQSRNWHIDADVLDQKARLVALRRHFHAHPEISLKEYQTAQRIEAELDQLGIAHRRVGETGVYATIEGEASGVSRTVALRADMDALGMQDLKECEYASTHPGLCHACGHDAHTAALLVAARVLKARSHTFSGQVRLFFQQAEEIGQGARQFVAAGLLEGVDRIYGSHVTSTLPAGQVGIVAGPMNASCDFFRIRVQGKGAHVSQPHKGVDALYVASQIVVALQSIVSRSTDPMQALVVGVGKAWAGTQYNILAQEAVLEGTTRALTHEVRALAQERVCAIAEQTAALYGAKAEVQFEAYSMPLINDAQAASEIAQVAADIVGTENVITDYPKSMGAEDFADYLPHCQGAFLYFGTRGQTAGSDSSIHNGHFDIDEEAMLIACNLYVRYALSVLQAH